MSRFSPRFSIVIPCFNAAATLAATLDSLQAQDRTDWEALVIDDGSTDDSARIAADYAAGDPRIRPLRNRGKGPSAARNMAMIAARGDILAFLDADDLWMPAKLSRLDAAFADPTVAACYGRVAFFDPSGARTVSPVPSDELTIAMLLGENPTCTLSNIAVRRAVFTATCGFDARIVHNEDLEWLIRLVGEGHRVVAIDAVLVMYRTSASGLSSDLAAMCAGRLAALVTAARYGARPGPRDEAVHLRYLARRALRVDAPGREALRLALRGVATSPSGWFSDLRRGWLTLTGALAAPLLPRALRQTLFAN